MKSDTRLEIRIPTNLKKALEDEADRKGITTAAYIKLTLSEAVNYQPKKKPKRARR